MPFPYKLVMATTCVTLSFAACAQSVAEIGRPAAVIPLASEPAPAPKFVAYPPLPDALARGVVIIPSIGLPSGPKTHSH